jgi:hypothetical protein
MSDDKNITLEIDSENAKLYLKLLAANIKNIESNLARKDGWGDFYYKRKDRDCLNSEKELFLEKYYKMKFKLEEVSNEVYGIDEKQNN